MKKAAKIRPFWYSDVWIWPKLITIVTSLDAEGRINAAPYSNIMQWDVMARNPRMMVGFRQDSHSFRNIVATGEFVVNCPSADHLDDMMETARFWPEGVNELEHTRFTMIPSTKVKPPSIAECPQIAECTVEEVIRLDKSTGIVIGHIEALVFDEALIDMDRGERIRAMNLPVGLGDQNRRDYYHAIVDEVTMHTLAETPDGFKGGEIRTGMPWEDGAIAALMEVPAALRKMVVDNTETWVRERGSDQVTLALFTQMAREYGMDEAMLQRFGG